MRGLTGASVSAGCKTPVKLRAGCHCLFRLPPGTDLVSVPTWKCLVLLSKKIETHVFQDLFPTNVLSGVFL